MSIITNDTIFITLIVIFVMMIVYYSILSDQLDRIERMIKEGKEGDR